MATTIEYHVGETFMDVDVIEDFEFVYTWLNQIPNDSYDTFLKVHLNNLDECPLAIRVGQIAAYYTMESN